MQGTGLNWILDQKRDISGKNWENPNGVCSLVHGNLLMVMSELCQIHHGYVGC